MEEFPRSSITGIELSDPVFWTLESHKLAIKYTYRGVNGKNDCGRFIFFEPGGTPSEQYLEAGQRVVRECLATAGYRLANLLNRAFGAK